MIRRMTGPQWRNPLRCRAHSRLFLSRTGHAVSARRCNLHHLQPAVRRARVQVLGGALRARRRSSRQRCALPSWAGAICQRLSMPGAPPSPGVRSSPSGGAPGRPQSLPRSRRQVQPPHRGQRRRVGQLATTSATAPARSASSAHHSRSSPRRGWTKRNRPGSTNAAMPSGFSLARSQPGAIHSPAPGFLPPVPGQRSSAPGRRPHEPGARVSVISGCSASCGRLRSGARVSR